MDHLRYFHHLTGRQQRLRQQTNRVVQDPPTYIVKTLGSRPNDREQDRAWVRAVVAIEKHRIEHNITDGRTAIGPEPPERDAYRSWCDARRTIKDASELLAPAVPARQVVAARELPSLDIEI